jgi:hypothetical protein
LFCHSEKNVGELIAEQLDRRFCDQFACNEKSIGTTTRPPGSCQPDGMRETHYFDGISKSPLRLSNAFSKLRLAELCLLDEF